MHMTLPLQTSNTPRLLTTACCRREGVHYDTIITITCTSCLRSGDKVSRSDEKEGHGT